MQSLMRYSWPGNNRQLENEVKRLIASVRGKTFTEEHLDPSIRHPEISDIPTPPAPAAQEQRCPRGLPLRNPRRSRR